MARLEGQGHTGLHDCPRPRSDARRRARRKTDRPHVTADPVGRGHCDPRSLMNAEQVQPNMPRALHKKSWAVIDRPYSLACATVGALYERPRCIFCAKPMQRKLECSWISCRATWSEVVRIVEITSQRSVFWSSANSSRGSQRRYPK